MNLVENSRAKLEKKGADMICANNLKVSGAGFGTDTNVITIITAKGEKHIMCVHFAFNFTAFLRQENCKFHV